MGKITKWDVELANFDVRFGPRTAIKGQVLADFVAEFSPRSELEMVQEPFGSANASGAQKNVGPAWKMFVDGASNSLGSGAEVVLVSPDSIMHEHSLRLSFNASNNEA